MELGSNLDSLWVRRPEEGFGGRFWAFLGALGREMDIGLFSLAFDLLASIFPSYFMNKGCKAGNLLSDRVSFSEFQLY